MFVLGILLLLVSTGALVGVLASGADDQAVLFGGRVEVPTMVIFLGGAAALLIFIMGLELMRSGLRRANQNRRAKRRLRQLEKDGGQRDETSGTPGARDDGRPVTRGEDAATPTQPLRTGNPTDDRSGTDAHNSVETRRDTGADTEGDTPSGTTGTPGPYQAPPPASR